MYGGSILAECQETCWELQCFGKNLPQQKWWGVSHWFKGKDIFVGLDGVCLCWTHLQEEHLPHGSCFCWRLSCQNRRNSCEIAMFRCRCYPPGSKTVRARNVDLRFERIEWKWFRIDPWIDSGIWKSNITAFKFQTQFQHVVILVWLFQSEMGWVYWGGIGENL